MAPKQCGKLLLLSNSVAISNHSFLKVGYLMDPFFFFLLSGFSFTNIHESQDCRGRGRACFYLLTTNFHLLHRHLDISRLITAESLPLHIASSQTRTGNLWFLRASRQPLSYAASSPFLLRTYNIAQQVSEMILPIVAGLIL